MPSPMYLLLDSAASNIYGLFLDGAVTYMYICFADNQAFRFSK